MRPKTWRIDVRRRSLKSSRAAGMAIGACKVIVTARVVKLLAAGRHFEQFRAAALRENGVAGVAIVGLDRRLPSSVLCLPSWQRKQPGQIMWPMLSGYSLQSAFISGKKLSV